jgi:hypothetical protein
MRTMAKMSMRILMKMTVCEALLAKLMRSSAGTTMNLYKLEVLQIGGDLQPINTAERMDMLRRTNSTKMNTLSCFNVEQNTAGPTKWSMIPMTLRR